MCGCTERCKGCDAAIMDGPQQEHSPECRRRIETLIVLDDTLDNLRKRLENRDTRLCPDPLDVSGQAPPDLLTCDVNSGSNSSGEEFSMSADEQENHQIREILAEPGHAIVTGSQSSGAADPTQDKTEQWLKRKAKYKLQKKRRLNVLTAEKRIIRKTIVILSADRKEES